MISPTYVANQIRGNPIWIHYQRQPYFRLRCCNFKTTLRKQVFSMHTLTWGSLSLDYSRVWQLGDTIGQIINDMLHFHNINSPGYDLLNDYVIFLWWRNIITLLRMKLWRREIYATLHLDSTITATLCCYNTGPLVVLLCRLRHELRPFYLPEPRRGYPNFYYFNTNKAWSDSILLNQMHPIFT